MAILICDDRHLVCYKHSNERLLTFLCNIEFINWSCLIFNEAYDGSYDQFTDSELNTLYTGMCGFKFEGFNRELLIQNVKKLAILLPESTGLELAKLQNQSALILSSDMGYYRYNPNSYSPIQTTEDDVPPAMRINCDFTPITYAPHRIVNRLHTHPNAVIYRAQENAFISTANTLQAHTSIAPNIPTAPRAPRAVSASNEHPKEGSKTGTVWIIAEKIWQENNYSTNWKDIRHKIVSACEAQGINSSTASVQYGKWKNTKI